MKIVLPLHPRTSKLLEKQLTNETYSAISTSLFFTIIPPASFLDMIELERNAVLVMTDSGGVQKEAFFFEKPCIILRSETEWKEIVEHGAGLIVNADKQKIIKAYEHFKNNRTMSFPKLYGDGKAAEFICKQLLNHAR